MNDIVFIRIPDHLATEINGFYIDPAIPIPVEKNDTLETGSLSSLSWEKIIAAMLKILAFHRDFQHTDYYRRFISAIKPELVFDLIDTGVEKARKSEFIIAEEIFLAVEGLEPENVTNLINMALLYEHMADKLEESETESISVFHEKSFDIYKKALGIDPSNGEIHYYAGQFFLNRFNYDKALMHLQQFIELSAVEEQIDRDNPDRIGRTEKIIKEIRSITDLDNLFKEAYDMIQLCREDEGIEKISGFLDKNPEVWNAWFLLGWGYRRKGDFEGGYKAFLKVIELGEKNADVLNEIALCCIETGKKAEAEKYLKEALSREPENTKIISNLGIMHYKNNDLNTAERFFLSALEYDKTDPIALKYSQLINDRKKAD